MSSVWISGPKKKQWNWIQTYIRKCSTVCMLMHLLRWMCIFMSLVCLLFAIHADLYVLRWHKWQSYTFSKHSEFRWISFCSGFMLLLLFLFLEKMVERRVKIHRQLHMLIQTKSIKNDNSSSSAVCANLNVYKRNAYAHT